MFKENTPFFFPDVKPAHIFKTSGTSDSMQASVKYSERGLKLMDLSILTNAKSNLIGDLYKPIIVRFVPNVKDAPEMVMAYGMELISKTYGHPELSVTVVERNGVNYEKLREALDMAVSEKCPVILIGASFSYVNICETLEGKGLRWELPGNSRMIDTGGFKGKYRVVDVDSLRSMVYQSFGINSANFVNLFGMTELASQLYDGMDIPIGPFGERPKRSQNYVELYVRDPFTMSRCTTGKGLLEVTDLCIIDRPYVILTGDIGLTSHEGIAVIDRTQTGQSRGCSLSLDTITRKEIEREQE